MSSSGHDLLSSSSIDNSNPSFRVLGGHSEGVSAIAISGDGTRVASCAQGVVRIWKPESDTLEQEIVASKDTLYAIDISSDGRKVIAGGIQKKIFVWDMGSGELLLTIKGHKYWIQALAISRDGNKIVSGCAKSVRLWDADRGEALHVLEDTASGFRVPLFSELFTARSVVFSPDDAHVATGGTDKLVKLWKIAGKHQPVVLRGHTNWVSSVVFSSDGEELISGSWDITTRIWNWKERTCIQVFKDAAAAICSVSISFDGKLVAAASKGEIVLWNRSGTVERSRRHTRDVKAIAFLPKGNELVSASEDKTLRIWDIGVNRADSNDVQDLKASGPGDEVESHSPLNPTYHSPIPSSRHAAPSISAVHGVQSPSPTIAPSTLSHRPFPPSIKSHTSYQSHRISPSKAEAEEAPLRVSSSSSSVGMIQRSSGPISSSIQPHSSTSTAVAKAHASGQTFKSIADGQNSQLKPMSHSRTASPEPVARLTFQNQAGESSSTTIILSPGPGPSSEEAPTASTRSTNTDIRALLPLSSNLDAKELRHRISSVPATFETSQSSPKAPITSLKPSSSVPSATTAKVELNSSSHESTPTTEVWNSFIPFSKKFSGRYQKNAVEPHARGGFSDVWKCHVLLDDSTTEAVALKELRPVNIPTNKSDPPSVYRRMIKRLEREIRVWARLEHLHIVPLIGFRFEPTCLISPWYSNGNIKEWIRKHPGIDRRKLMLQVADGLVYLHSMDPPIIHGDIKSDNVLISDEGNAVINDFGLSQIIEDASAESTNTNSMADVGNARWLAPEIFIDGMKRSTASDVYAFGCLLLEIATGAMPYRGLPDMQVIRALMSGKAPATDRATYPELTENDSLWDLMSDCWGYEYEARPTMKAIKARLQT